MYFTREDILKIQQELVRLGIKDSQFSEAKTPLNHNDTITLVQGKHNVKISIHDFLEQLHLLSSEDFLNVSVKFDEYALTLTEAIRIIPMASRKVGLTITFQSIDGNWEIWQYNSHVLNQWNNPEAWENVKVPLESLFIPDEEDITAIENDNGGSIIKLKDKEYKPIEFSGKGRVYLRKNIQKVMEPVTKGILTKNLLTQNMVGKENTIYIIQYDYDLNGQTVIIPDGCVLRFDGGSISNGELRGTQTVIDSSPITIFNNLSVTGTWKAPDYLCEWFNNDVEKCLKVFKAVSFIGSYVFDKTINIDDYVSVLFKEGSQVTVSDNFAGDYLFNIKEIRHGLNTDASYYNPQISFTGSGDICLNCKCGFLNSFSQTGYTTKLLGLNVRRIGKNGIESFITINPCVITCCKFCADRKVTNSTPRCGIKLNKADNQLSQVILVINTIGVDGCAGYSVFNDVHVWGAPQIAFRITGQCSFTDCHGDWAKVSYFVTTNTTINIKGHRFITTSSQGTDFSTCYFIKCANWFDLRGTAELYETYANRHNIVMLSYGPEDNNDNNTQYLTWGIKLKRNYMADIPFKPRDFNTTTYTVDLKNKNTKLFTFLTRRSCPFKMEILINENAYTIYAKYVNNQLVFTLDGNINTYNFQVINNFYYKDQALYFKSIKLSDQSTLNLTYCLGDLSKFPITSHDNKIINKYLEDSDEEISSLQSSHKVSCYLGQQDTISTIPLTSQNHQRIASYTQYIGTAYGSIGANNHPTDLPDGWDSNSNLNVLLQSKYHPNIQLQKLFINNDLLYYKKGPSPWMLNIDAIPCYSRDSLSDVTKFQNVPNNCFVYERANKRILRKSGNDYYDALGNLVVAKSGITPSRPTLPNNKEVGTQYFDTTLGKPIWWTGVKWVDSTGADV